MTREEKWIAALLIVGFLGWYGFAGALAEALTQHDRLVRTCQLAQPAMTRKADSLFLTYAEWCK